MNVSINQLVSATPQTIAPQTVLMQHMAFFSFKGALRSFREEILLRREKSLLTDFFHFFLP